MFCLTITNRDPKIYHRIHRNNEIVMITSQSLFPMLHVQLGSSNRIKSFSCWFGVLTNQEARFFLRSSLSARRACNP